MGDALGRLFRLTTFGESHGVAVGGVLEGCPPGMTLDIAAIEAQLRRRRPGQSSITSTRKERDQLEILSGLDAKQRTLGTAIGFCVRNEDADSTAYAADADKYRPSHADYTYEARYGLRAWAGGGRASARETVSRVVGGAIARAVLAELGSVEVVAWVDRVGSVQAKVDDLVVTAEAVDASIVRCPDLSAAAQMEQVIRQARSAGDSVGGVVRIVARGVPAGLGDPVFDKLDADLAHAMMSIPAVKGVEIGSGFAGTAMTGLQHNDVFVPGSSGEICTATNHSGGIQGGISNGMSLTVALAFKPVATVFRAQQTVDRQGLPTTIKPRGRHDPCVLPRAIPVVEAMMYLVLADHWLRWRAQVGAPPVRGA